MKISRSIYEQLLQLPKVPPEMGGILGSRSNKIDTMVLDINKPSYHSSIYVPNISFLNKCIAKWNEVGITFMGMFHTHALNWPNLSSEDRKYILHIMNAMPDWMDRLYFPLVFPSNFIKAFLAEKSEGKISITEDNVEIIEEVSE